MTAADAILAAQNIAKSYDGTEALKSIDFHVSAGEVVSLLGPNGAGKTTAISIALGQRPADAGEVSLFGGNPAIPANRTRLGLTPQETAFPDNLKVSEILDLVAAHYPEPADRQELLTHFGLAEKADVLASKLSGGQRRILAVALAFAGRPRIVFLDEPTTGLDPGHRKRLWARIRAFVADGGAVFLTTHYLEEAEALADRVILIDHGKIIDEGSVGDIRSRVDVRIVRITAPAVPDWNEILQSESDGERHTLYTRDPDALIRRLVREDIEFHDLEVRPASLEEAVMTVFEGKAS